MGRKRTPGLQLRKGSGTLTRSCTDSELSIYSHKRPLRSGKFTLAHRIETIRQSTVYGVRPTRLFKDAAAKYLRRTCTNARSAMTPQD